MIQQAESEAGRVAVELVGVFKTFGSVHAVRDVNVEVRSGELISLLGASGSGKSTLLRMIAGFDRPTSGEIRLHGENVVNRGPADRDVGMVFQNYALFPHLTVERNIAYGLRMRGWKADRRAERVREMVERMRLAGLEKRLPRELSGGQQQRVAIARALAYEPGILLMDEPLGALDKALKRDLLQEIRRVHRDFRTTILYVTHDREEALTLSDRVALMEASNLVACEPVREMYLNPPTAFAAQFFSEANLVPSDVVEWGEEHRQRAAAGVLALRPRQLRLEQRSGDASIDARIDDVIFLGDESHIKVSRERSDEILQFNALVSLDQSAELGIGERVRLHFAPEDAQLVREPQKLA